MATERALKELDCTNISKEWPAWKSEFLMYMLATDKIGGAEEKKIATFLWLAGRQAREIYNTLYPNDGTATSILGSQNSNQIAGGDESNGDSSDTVSNRKLEDILKEFDKFCIPKSNPTLESFKLNNIVQKEGQPFSEFETDLRKQLQLCNFSCRCECGKVLKYEERILKDRIIIGVRDMKLQLKLLEGSNESLQRFIDSCKAFEASTASKALLTKTAQPFVNSVIEEETSADSVNAVVRRCYNCGQVFTSTHLRVCKPNNVICRACGRKGHFERYCKSKGKQADGKDGKDNNFKKQDDNRKTDKKNLNISNTLLTVPVQNKFERKWVSEKTLVQRIRSGKYNN
ncbi:uncharacterized protein [Eurosta solidaginis]|uniref:uncharacterized protein isoform X2 n=1 Tax=Eurosta solidaginis TaxID=178769 RepID=UPI0035312C75